MTEKIQGVRGMNDLLPDASANWRRVETVLRRVAGQYGYQEIRTPLLEKTALFRQSIGDQTDIVEKEMYTFTDSGDESLTLRPEATASTVRACIEHGLLHNRQQRLWYMGPMFRRERPQKGRYRQFHQFGIEAFGWDGPDIDAEVIRVGERILKEIGIEQVRLEVNSLGSDATRAAYRDDLKNYLEGNRDALDADSLRRLETNPLRVLDSKNPDLAGIIAGAPSILERMKDAERAHFDGLCASLSQSGIEFTVNPTLVRGLDYYTSTVFEWTTPHAGAQNTVCAGGRYDALVANRGGQATPGVGFAMGLERLVEMGVEQGRLDRHDHPDVYMIDITGNPDSAAGRLSEELRDAGKRVIDHCGGGRLKAQLRRADQCGARVAMIMGESEMASGVVQVKHLRKNSAPFEIPVSGLVEWAVENLS